MSGSALSALLLALLQVPAAQPHPPSTTGQVVDARTHEGPLTLSVTRAAGPIRIDGELDDEGWRNATRAVGWTEFNPGDRTEPPAQTEAWLTYDDSFLYVAFIAEADPRRIRASLADRDRIWNDDAVGIVLDTYGDGATGVLIVANPLGVQGDLLLTPRGDDPSYDLIFFAEARITESGYQVEMAIPFRSLRFRDRDVQTWLVNFYRQHPRSSRHQIAWAPLDQNNPCVLCQSAPLHGIEGIRPGSDLELLPALVATQSAARSATGDPTTPFVNERPVVRASLGVTYGFSSDWTAEGTLNPDFSQVESDAAQVDVNTTFALFFPERRPFFQEGSDLFDTDVDVVYTRSINAPLAAGKLTGRLGESTRLAYLGARDRHTPFLVPLEERTMIVQAGPSVSNIVRLRHGLGGDSHVGLLLTDRRLDGGGSGSNISVDARLRFAQNYTVRSQLVGSYTVEPDDPDLTGGAGLTFGRGAGSYTAAFDGERFGGHAALLGFNRSARHLNFGVTYTEASPTYRADVGFQTRNDYRRVTANTSYTFYPAAEWLERIGPGVNGGLIHNTSGQQKDVWLSPSVGMALPGQTFVNVNAMVSRETFRDVAFEGVRRMSVNLNSNPDPRLSFGFSASRGRSIARFLETPVLGHGRDVSVWASIKPTQRLALEPSLAWSRLDDPDGETFYDSYILRGRTTYQFTRELFVRVVTQYNGFADRFDVEPLVMYRLNPFSIFYLGATTGFQTFGDPHHVTSLADRQVFVKFQYLLRM